MTEIRVCWVYLTVNADSIFAILKSKQMAASVSSVVLKFYDDYSKTTPTKLKLIDSYLFYIFLTGVIQFVYCCLVGTFPFNSFLSGFISSVGSFVLAGMYFFKFRMVDRITWFKKCNPTIWLQNIELWISITNRPNPIFF